MSKITFKSGEVYEFEGSVSAYEAAAALGIISREIITARVNGELTELSTPITGYKSIGMTDDSIKKVLKYEHMTAVFHAVVYLIFILVLAFVGINNF